jgi:uncharacterized protein (DUF1778 family)
MTRWDSLTLYVADGRIFSGTSASEFVIGAALSAALTVLRSSQLVSQAASDAERFCAALDAPQAPTEALRELMAAHDDRVAESAD